MESMSEVDIIAGTADRHMLPYMLRSSSRERQDNCGGGHNEKRAFEDLRINMGKAAPARS